MKRGGGRKGPRQPGGGKQTAGPPRKSGRPVEGRGGRKDRFGGRGGKSRAEDERGERKFGGRPGGKSAGKSSSKFGGERRDDKPRAAASTRQPEGRNASAKRALPPRARGEGWGEGAPRRPEPRREEAVRPMQKAEPEISPALAAATKVQTVTVSPDENGMRVDRFFEARFPGLSFSHIQRIVRKGEVRVNGKRTETKSRLEAGQEIRIPPLQLAAPRVREDSPQVLKDREYLRSITLAEDDDVLVLNKPMGLAVQGGSGTTRHVDGLLEALRGPGVDAQRPRLVHRLDKDTAGCLLIAKTRFAAAALAKTFRTRSARKIYWALVAGVPKPRQGRISAYLAKQEMEEDSFMRVAKHGERDAVHAVTYYAVVETSAQKLAWVSLKPVTGRTHQLRAHMAHIGNPIVGDPKYFNIENWELPGGIQNKLHLLARRIVVPHPRGGTIDVSAPLPPHMQQSWNLLGLDAERFDPIVDAPDED
ncbi:MAG TPA: RluA family pseudouridine synthase [Pseudolabrys sp.]|nr:RluA family pseudouridine synthase [Pseudolabrys sp.]